MILFSGWGGISSVRGHQPIQSCGVPLSRKGIAPKLQDQDPDAAFDVIILRHCSIVFLFVSGGVFSGISLIIPVDSFCFAAACFTLLQSMYLCPESCPCLLLWFPGPQTSCLLLTQINLTVSFTCYLLTNHLLGTILGIVK